LNLSKNPGTWVKAKAIPAELYGLSAEAWFNLGYVVVTGVALTLLCLHQRRRLPVVPENPLGQGQLLYLAFLWFVVIGNFGRALTGFAPQRLVTEGVIHLNAALCTLLILVGSPARMAVPAVEGQWPRAVTRRIVAIGMAALVLTVTLDWAIVRAIYGNRFAGHAGLHIRFGPNATANRAKPNPNQPHP
jgi:hypothetical protein